MTASPSTALWPSANLTRPWPWSFRRARPRCRARLADTSPSQRDQHIELIQNKGRIGWQRAVGYGRRSHAETAVFRYKGMIGSSLRARTLPAQKAEARAACSVLNRMTRLGMPMSQRIA
jgi:hypothetical protein